MIDGESEVGKNDCGNKKWLNFEEASMKSFSISFYACNPLAQRILKQIYHVLPSFFRSPHIFALMMVDHLTPIIWMMQKRRRINPKSTSTFLQHTFIYSLKMDDSIREVKKQSTALPKESFHISIMLIQYFSAFGEGLKVPTQRWVRLLNTFRRTCCLTLQTNEIRCCSPFCSRKCCQGKWLRISIEFEVMSNHNFSFFPSFCARKSFSP